MKTPDRLAVGAGEIKARRSRGLNKVGRPPKNGRQTYDIEGVTNAAVRVFNRQGYEASSMEDVARETGLTKSSIYYHVASKEELLARALARAFGPLLGVLREPGATVSSPLDRLKYVVCRAVAITLEFAQEVELLQRIKGNTYTERQALEWRRRFDREVRSLVEQAAQSGRIRSDLDPGLITRLIFGMSNSITQWYRPAKPLGADEIAAALYAVVFEGIERTD